MSRALGSGKQGKRVLDLSAGLGIDAVFLAQLGYHVTAVERNPFIYIALKTALDHLTANYRSNLKFVFDQAQNFLQNNTCEFDVCYFDPMFPSKTKAALPKQEMVFFKNLVGSDEDAATVLEIALSTKKFKRCVVKRPLSAEPLLKPAGHIKGKIIRYDIYSS
jgi:16S rRNA (guanine1516-N2)-methyltransferase